MIIPFIASVARDVFSLVPSMSKESAYGLGATTWEVIRGVVIPHTRWGSLEPSSWAWDARWVRPWP